MAGIENYATTFLTTYFYKLRSGACLGGFLKALITLITYLRIHLRCGVKFLTRSICHMLFHISERFCCWRTGCIGLMNVSTGGWLSSSAAPFLLERGYFKKELLLFFFSYKECFVFFFNENEWQVPSDGLFPCLFKSLVAKTLSVIRHRSYHKEECQNRTHSSQPLC